MRRNVAIRRAIQGAAASVLAAGLLAGACSGLERKPAGPLLPGAVARSASAAGLDVARAVVFTDNDDAFESKLALVRGARESLDLAYFIFDDDYSSSLLAQELVEAARRGVRVRLLLDYHTNYRQLDRLTALERFGGEGAGSFEVRFYNRPTRNIVRDAAFLTLSCAEAGAQGTAGCSEAKYAEIDRRFAGERIDGVPVGERNVSNLDSGGSGLFLAGLYGRNPRMIQFAVTEGQDIDPARLRGAGEIDAAGREQLGRLGRLYFQSRFGSGLDRATARLRFAVAGLLFGDQVDPLHDAITAYLPLERREGREAARQDWDYLTDYLHHKLVVADGERFQLGGRNVEDSYHMTPNPLLEKYVFMDTDVRVELRAASAAMVGAFDRLWSYDAMVARLDEVRAHAPNDELIAHGAAADACEDAGPRGEAAYQECFAAALVHSRAVPLAERERQAFARLADRATRFRAAYRARPEAERGPEFVVDPGAEVHYVENLPFAVPGGPRQYGARNGAEAESGKHIHALWLAALRDACGTATAIRPQQVILHNAYFFPPSNLLAEFARMVDGREPCPHVRVTVLTNSTETTDLAVVNLAARHAVKAFAEHVEAHRDPTLGATFRYFEYRPPAAAAGEEATQLSLHSKVSVFGLDTIVIGSANADVRSYMMDSNNGLLIRGAPELVERYAAWVEGLLAGGTRATDLTAYFRTTPREQMRAEDVETIRAMLAQYGADRQLDEEQVRQVEAKAVGILDEIYRLAGESLLEGSRGRRGAEQFNALFKAI